MRYVQNMGYIWRLSERSYKKLCADLKVGQIDLDRYGKVVVKHCENLTDLEEKIENDNLEDDGAAPRQ